MYDDENKTFYKFKKKKKKIWQSPFSVVFFNHSNWRILLTNRKTVARLYTAGRGSSCKYVRYGWSLL